MERMLWIGFTILLTTGSLCAAAPGLNVLEECAGEPGDETYPDDVTPSGDDFTETTNDRIDDAVTAFNGGNVIVTDGLGALSYDRENQVLSGTWMQQPFSIELEAVKGGSNRDTFMGGPGNKVGLRPTKMPAGERAGASTIAQIALEGIFEKVDTSCWSDACKGCLKGAKLAAQACELDRQGDLAASTGGDDGIAGNAVRKDQKKLCKAAEDALEDCADCPAQTQSAIPNPQGGSLSCAACGS